MIAFVRGKVWERRNDSVIIDTGALGYEVFVSNPSKCIIGEDCMLYTYQHVREDAIILFGFLTREAMDLFVRLISVKGVGPKTAMNMMSVISAGEMIQAIENEDIKVLKSLPGIGAKSASQIVLDLKGKLAIESSDISSDGMSDNLKDALDALSALGYRQQDINYVKKELEKEEEMTREQYTRKALALLAASKGV